MKVVKVTGVRGARQRHAFNRLRYLYQAPDAKPGEDDGSDKITPFKELTMDPSEAREFPRAAGCPGLRRPDWLTLKKWESWPPGMKLRRPDWWLMTHDENGNMWYERNKRVKIEEAVENIFRMYQVYPRSKNPLFLVDIHTTLDPKFPDQQVRSAVELPHGSGKEVRVAVFCGPDEEKEVLEMGAYKAGMGLFQEIEEGKIDFDVLITKPQMMPQLAKLGRVLGPKKLMPSPKASTVVTDYKTGIDTFAKGSVVELRPRNTDYGFVDIPVGNVSMTKEQIVGNVRALTKGFVDKAPPGAKNPLFTRVWIRCTATPAFIIELTEFPKVKEDDD